MIPINVFGWKVKGFVIADNFILKAVKRENTNNKEKKHQNNQEKKHHNNQEKKLI